MPLENYQQFKEILDKYRVSETAKELLEPLRLVLVVAPTSSGKNTIIRRLMETGKFYRVISDTTRAPRVNDGVLEKNGEDYWFKSEEEMLAGLKVGNYLEAELIHGQQVSGISIAELEKASQADKTALDDVDIKGVHNIIRAKPDTLVILLLPPNFEEWQRRLAQRGRMSPQEQERRFESAQRIFEDGLKEDFYQFVIAEDVGQSAAIIEAIVEGKSNPHQDRGRNLIISLQNSLKEKIEGLHNQI